MRTHGVEKAVSVKRREEVAARVLLWYCTLANPQCLNICEAKDPVKNDASNWRFPVFLTFPSSAKPTHFWDLEAFSLPRLDCLKGQKVGRLC